MPPIEVIDDVGARANDGDPRFPEGVNVEFVEVLTDGTLRVDGRLCLEVENGDLVYGIYKGRWKIAPETMARLGEPGGVDPGEYRLRITFEFETASVAYDWLNQIMAIASGRKTEAGIAYSVYEVA